MTDDPSIHVTHDMASDVLYMKLAGTHIANSHESPGDDYIILNYDTLGTVVGVQFLAVSEMTPDFWKLHPSRTCLPRSILGALDRWFASYVE